MPSKKSTNMWPHEPSAISRGKWRDPEWRNPSKVAKSLDLKFGGILDPSFIPVGPSGPVYTGRKTLQNLFERLDEKGGV